MAQRLDAGMAVERCIGGWMLAWWMDVGVGMDVGWQHRGWMLVRWVDVGLAVGCVNGGEIWI